MKITSRILILIVIFSMSKIANAELNKDSLNNVFNELMKQYCSAYSFEERVDLVCNADELYDVMEDHYSGAELKGLGDSSSYMHLIYSSLLSRPLIKDRKNPGYYYKEYIILNDGQEQRDKYYSKVTDQGLLIDWEASVKKSSLSMESFKIKKPTDYYSKMRLWMKLEEDYESEEVPGYYTVRINQPGDKTSERAYISKENEVGEAVFNELSDGKWHTTIAWVKFMNWVRADRKPSSSWALFEDNILVGKVNSFEKDSWIEKLNDQGVPIEMNCEDENLKAQQNAYEMLKKAIAEIESNTPKIIAINSAKTEYYGKEVSIKGFAQLDDYYNYGYRDAESTHYSIKVSDHDYETLHIYIPKSKSKELFDLLVSEKEIPIQVTILIYENKQGENFGRVLCEGISYSLYK